MSDQRQNSTQGTLVGGIQDDILNFTVGKDRVLDLFLLDADCIGTAAHVTMLSEMPTDPPILTASEKDAVLEELAVIMRAGHGGKVTITATDQDVHLAVERMLTEKLGEIGKKVHTGRSRNDQVALDLRLYGREELLQVMQEAAALAGGLLTLAARHEKLPMVGRTHHQPAMPSSVGLWASAHAESLLEDLTLVQAVHGLTNRNPLGSAAGYGVPLPIDRERTTELLAFDAPIHNVLYASNARGKNETLILSTMSQIMITLSRLARDLIQYSMPEFGYFTLPAECCTGSSIMPQKKNPDVLELVRAKTQRVLGYHATAAGVVAGIPGGYNRDLQEVKELLIEGVGTTRACLRIMLTAVTRLKVHEEALRAGFVPGVYAADRALELVASGQPFRDAYEYVRTHLDELEKVDPDAAVAQKSHLGAPAGLNLKSLQEAVEHASDFAKQQKKRYDSCISKLLGSQYPV